MKCTALMRAMALVIATGLLVRSATAETVVLDEASGKAIDVSIRMVGDSAHDTDFIVGNSRGLNLPLREPLTLQEIFSPVGADELVEASTLDSIRNTFATGNKRLSSPRPSSDLLESYFRAEEELEIREAERMVSEYNKARRTRDQEQAATNSNGDEANTQDSDAAGSGIDNPNSEIDQELVANDRFRPQGDEGRNDAANNQGVAQRVDGSVSTADQLRRITLSGSGGESLGGGGFGVRGTGSGVSAIGPSTRGKLVASRGGRGRSSGGYASVGQDWDELIGRRKASASSADDRRRSRSIASDIWESSKVATTLSGKPANGSNIVSSAKGRTIRPISSGGVSMAKLDTSGQPNRLPAIVLLCVLTAVVYVTSWYWAKDDKSSASA